MGLRAGHNARVYLNGVDISGDIGTVTPKMENELAQYATFGSTGYKYFPGLGKDEVSLDGLYNNTSIDILDALFAATTGYAMMIVYGTTYSDPAVACNELKLGPYEVKSVASDINRMNATLRTHNYPFEPGILVYPKTQVTSDNTGTIINNGAQSTAGCVAHLQVFEQTGGTGCTISLRHSTDNFVASDDELLTFGSKAAAGADRETAAGTVRQWVRAKWVFAGGGPYTCTFAIILQRL